MKIINILLISILLLIACSSSGSSGWIRSLESNANTVAINNEVTITTTFSAPYHAEDVGDDTSYFSDPFYLYFLIPIGLEYIDGSSQLYNNYWEDDLFGDPDHKPPFALTDCEDGTFALVYEFEEDEFYDPESEDNFFLEYKLNSVLSLDGEIQAFLSESPAQFCGSTLANKAVKIVVTP